MYLPKMPVIVPPMKPNVMRVIARQLLLEEDEKSMPGEEHLYLRKVLYGEMNMSILD